MGCSCNFSPKPTNWYRNHRELLENGNRKPMRPNPWNHVFQGTLAPNGWCWWETRDFPSPCRVPWRVPSPAVARTHPVPWPSWNMSRATCTAATAASWLMIAWQVRFLKDVGWCWMMLDSCLSLRLFDSASQRPTSTIIHSSLSQGAALQAHSWEFTQGNALQVWKHWNPSNLTAVACCLHAVCWQAMWCSWCPSNSSHTLLLPSGCCGIFCGFPRPMFGKWMVWVLNGFKF